MDKPWLKMKRQIESLWAPCLQGRMAIHMKPFANKGCGTRRHWITLDGKVIWDYPVDFYNETVGGPGTGIPYSVISPPRGEGFDRGVWQHVPYPEEVIRYYLDCPMARIFEPMTVRRRYPLPHGAISLIDKWDLGDLFRAADRRLGQKRLMWWMFFEMDGGSPAKKVLSARFKNPAGEGQSSP